jgi:hypothetical protein
MPGSFCNIVFRNTRSPMHRLNMKGELPFMSNTRKQLIEIIEMKLSENEVIFVLEFLKKILHLD